MACHYFITMLQWFCTALVAGETFAAVVIEENDLDCHAFAYIKLDENFTT